MVLKIDTLKGHRLIQHFAQIKNCSQKGRVEIKLDKGANVHVRIGTVEFNEDQILDNLKSVYSVILNSRPENLKGQFIKTATICSTMGPSVKLNLNEMENFSNISS